MSKKKSFYNNGDKIVFMEDSRGGRLFSTYSLIAKNRFRWSGLPEGIDSHKIEEFLYNCGQVAFFKNNDKKFDTFMCLPCTSNGQFNVYGEPTSYQVTGVDFSESYLAKDVVRIKNNDICTPTRNQVIFYTNWISDIERTMRKNLKQLRQSDIIATTKDNELTVRAMWNKVDGDETDEPIFYDKDTFRGEFPIQVLNRNVTNNLDSLQKNKNDVMFELLTFLGINNANTSKKERMIVDEVNVNNIHILMNLDIEYKCRLDACKEINEKFGTNISVELVIEELKDKFMKPELENNENNENNQ